MQDTYRRVSTDGGLNWSPNIRVSDVSTPIVFDGATLPCYHGDYDQSLVTSDGGLVAQWSDDRVGSEGANVFTDVEGGGAIFEDGFESGDVTLWTGSVP